MGLEGAEEFVYVIVLAAGLIATATYEHDGCLKEELTMAERETCGTADRSPYTYEREEYPDGR